MMQTYQELAPFFEADARTVPEADFPASVVEQIKASATFLAGIKASRQRQSGSVAPQACRR